MRWASTSFCCVLYRERESVKHVKHGINTNYSKCETKCETFAYFISGNGKLIFFTMIILIAGIGSLIMEHLNVSRFVIGGVFEICDEGAGVRAPA
jgi:hypothetical protein